MRKKLKLGQEKKICGVCEGIGNYLDIDPVIIRILYIIFILCVPILPIILYFLMYLIIPAYDSEK